MSALKFKIEPEALILLNWDECEPEDKEFILECLENNHMEWERRYTLNTHQIVLKGLKATMFSFLYEVASRYDIEII